MKNRYNKTKGIRYGRYSNLNELEVVKIYLGGSLGGELVSTWSVLQLLSRIVAGTLPVDSSRI